MPLVTSGATAGLSDVYIYIISLSQRYHLTYYKPDLCFHPHNTHTD